MKWLDDKEDLGSGAFVLGYGGPGFGKTLSTLLTCPLPALYLGNEPRNLLRTCKGNLDLNKKTKVDGKEVNAYKVGYPDNFEDAKDFLTDNSDAIIEKGYKTVILDGVTHLMSVSLVGELKEEASAAGIFDNNKRKLANKGRGDMVIYGTIAKLMKDITAVAGKLTQSGLLMVFITLQQANPKWGRDDLLEAGPSFAGQEYGKDAPGFFDLIGRVEARTDEKTGKAIYPPLIHFGPPKSDFLSKWTGPPIESHVMPLNWTEILKKGGAK